MTGLRKALGSIALLAAVGLWMLPAQAGGHGLGRGRDDPAFHRGQRIIDVHTRYPGDVSYSFGTARLKEPDKGPYVERCTWSASNTLFGVPLGLTQRCIRYTNQNTN